MNMRAMKENIPEYETGKLPIALYPDNLLKNADGSRPCFARVINRGNFDMDDIANDLVSGGSPFTKEEILTCWHEAWSAIIDRLVNGGRVDAQAVSLSLGVTGLFHSEQSDFDRKKNSIELHVKPTEYLQNILDSLECVSALGLKTAPFVRSVYDMESKTENLFLTRGGFIEIKGLCLKILGATSR